MGYAGYGGGSMKEKNFHRLIFRLYSLQNQVTRGRPVGQFPRLRPISGRAVVRWKTKRKKEWEKRNVR
jgi:hypothetical protein